MANSTKVAIVGLMILLVVVVAQYVKNDTPLSGGAESTEGTASEEGKGGAGGTDGVVDDGLAKNSVGERRPATGRGARLSQARMQSLPRNAVIDRRPSRSYITGRSNRSTGVEGGAGDRRQSRNPASGGSRGGSFSRVGPSSGAGQAGSRAASTGTPSGALVNTATTAEGTAITAEGTAITAEGRAITTEGRAITTEGRAITTEGRAASGGIAPPVSNAERERRRLAEAERLRQLAASRIPDSSSPSGAGTSGADARAYGGGRKQPVQVPTKTFGGSKARPSLAAGSPVLSSVGFPKQHLVKEGDSYWALSRKYYGAGRHYAFIETANNKAKVISGKTLTIPALPAEAIKDAEKAKKKALAEAAASKGRKRRVSTNRPNKPRRSSALATSKGSSSGSYKLYNVRKGDTLSELAKRFYGDYRLTSRITDANVNLRYIQLQADTTIRIPPK